jgi:DNA-directed RNA polymerase subunit L
MIYIHNKWFSDRMNVQVVKSSAKETELSLKGTDIGTLYIVQHELLKESQVDFAGVILRHPLTAEYRMRINSSKGSPLKEVEKATKAAIESAQELKQLIHSKIKGV